MLWLHILFYGQSGYVSLYPQPGIARDIVKTAHSYHGILISYEDDTGCYFIRKNQKCKLFTSAFIKYYFKKKGGDMIYDE